LSLYGLLASLFQSPSLRGSGRFPARMRARRGVRFLVSIPFIAGQWSLPEALLKRLRHVLEFQSPSLRGSGRFRMAGGGGASGDPARFNPLHCGAVVASRSEARRRAFARRVSIPFIAGQWSLRAP